MADVYLFTCCTGSAGNIGGHAVHSFYSQLPEGSTATVRLGVRKPEKARKSFAELLKQSPHRFEIVHLDLSQPSSYATALKDTTAVFLGQPDSGGIDSKALFDAFIDAAASSSRPPLIVSFVAGVTGDDKSREELQSLFQQTGCVLFEGHFRTYNALADARATGRIRVSFVDVASWFFQNYVWMFADLIKANYLAIPNGNANLPYIDARDVGDVVACVMKDNEKYANRDFLLTGAVKMAASDWAKKFSEVLRRDVAHSTDPEPLKMALSQVQEAPGLNLWDLMGPFYETEKLMAEADEPLHPEIFEEVTGKKHRSADDFIGEFAAMGVWDPAS
eukprot:Plantae.Rhodophyta-Rhodochaete_pulchella.ctg1861.p1 GENE.Plantae.Rhodophyta-Rhodochaete_pulchella.ctg1861~~Plantae.Rhodophyta-Rhodochaete_pulchella.ctg1861.p1  ORF type:complete len:333 (+),score=58.12 Plantae.Rhodophyta-Rhodochaete_pulchella.ctg1861:55-1053(+)